MYRLLIIVLTIVTIGSAQQRKFPLSQNDFPFIYNILGQRSVLMTANTALKKIKATYETNRHTTKVIDGILFCADDAGVSYEDQNITRVKVFTDKYGVTKVSVSIKDKGDFSITSNGIRNRRGLALR